MTMRERREKGDDNKREERVTMTTRKKLVF